MCVQDFQRTIQLQPVLKASGSVKNAIRRSDFLFPIKENHSIVVVVVLTIHMMSQESF